MRAFLLFILFPLIILGTLVGLIQFGFNVGYKQAMKEFYKWMIKEP